MAVGRLFLSYSGADGLEFALRLADALEAGPPCYEVWIDKRDLRPGSEWDEQVEEALHNCRCLLFVMTRDSVKSNSMCKQEWSRALRYTKPVIPLRLDADAEMPFRLGSRQYIEFGNFISGIAQLRRHLVWMTSNEGNLSELKVRLADANREFSRTTEDRRPVIEAEIEGLRRQIDQFQRLISNQVISNQAGPVARVQDRVDGMTALIQQPPARQGADGLVGQAAAGSRHDHRPADYAGESAISAPDMSEAELEAFGLPNRIGMDAHRLGAELVAGSIVLDSAICAYTGVDLSNVVINEMGSLDDLTNHPAFILDEKRGSIAPVPNRPKAHLVDWHAPVIDQGDIVTLDVARSDYWTSEATKRSVSRIQREVISGRLDLMRMPRRLDVHLIVISEDDGMLLLARRGSHVATEPSTWMISVGESMDWDHDKDADGALHPTLTARRCLSERDELNLPYGIVESASLRLVAIATEWTEMLANLIVTARIPEVTFNVIRRYFRRGENSQLDAIAFDPESCAALLRSDTYAGSSGKGIEMPISDISRLALLAALRATYPLSEVVAAATPARERY